MNSRQEVLDYLIKSDRLVKMSTAAVVNGIVDHDIIVIHEAAPVTVREIVTKFGLVSLRSDGLHIPAGRDTQEVQ